MPWETRHRREGGCLNFQKVQFNHFTTERRYYKISGNMPRGTSKITGNQKKLTTLTMLPQHLTTYNLTKNA